MRWLNRVKFPAADECFSEGREVNESLKKHENRPKRHVALASTRVKALKIRRIYVSGTILFHFSSCAGIGLPAAVMVAANSRTRLWGLISGPCGDYNQRAPKVFITAIDVCRTCKDAPAKGCRTIGEERA
jgi:hypothetical protein